MSGGRLYLVDTSALAKAHLSQVRYTVQTLITDRVAATCVTVDLAAGYSGRNAADLAAIDARRRDRYINLPLTEQIAERSREVQGLLAEKLQHRSVGIIDLLTAAVAELHDAVLLHYDPSFEFIAAITGQPQLWVAARGSLEAEQQEFAEQKAAEQKAAEQKVAEQKAAEQGQSYVTAGAGTPGTAPHTSPDSAPHTAPHTAADPIAVVSERHS